MGCQPIVDLHHCWNPSTHLMSAIVHGRRVEGCKQAVSIQSFIYIPQVCKQDFSNVCWEQQLITCFGFTTQTYNSSISTKSYAVSVSIMYHCMTIWHGSFSFIVGYDIPNENKVLVIDYWFYFIMIQIYNINIFAHKFAQFFGMASIYQAKHYDYNCTTNFI